MLWNELGNKYFVGGYNADGKWVMIQGFHTYSEAKHFKNAHLWRGTGLSPVRQKVRV